MNETQSNIQLPDPEPNDKYDEALSAYMSRYGRNGQRPMLSLRANSTVGTSRVYLRGIGFLISIYDFEVHEFIPLTKELIRRYTDQSE